MKKLILVDGNNLLFRSYYATAYNGNLMKNSDGFPTNALFGFVNMINKIINEEKPEYIAYLEQCIAAAEKQYSLSGADIYCRKEDVDTVSKICKFQKPLSGKITSEFGAREATIEGMTTDHKGIDIASPCGTDIIAAASGTVVSAGWGVTGSGYGYSILVNGISPR